MLTGCCSSSCSSPARRPPSWSSRHGVRRPEAAPTRTDPQAADAWKSPHGIFAVCGPGFAQDALVFGATVLDVAPTVLTWFGLPIGDDMEGRVLLESFDPARKWRGGKLGTGNSRSPAGSAETPGSSADSPGAAQLQREWDWNLALSYLDAGRCDQALQCWRACFALSRSAWSWAKRSFNANWRWPKWPRPPRRSRWCWRRSRRDRVAAAAGRAVRGQWQSGEAAVVHQARDLHPAHPDALRRLGLLLLRLRSGRRWPSWPEALKLDENEPLAWLGLAEAQLRQRLPAEAEEAALRAIGLDYYFPQATSCWRGALIAQSKWQQAGIPCRRCCAFSQQPHGRAYANAWGSRPGLNLTQKDGRRCDSGRLSTEHTP